MLRVLKKTAGPTWLIHHGARESFAIMDTNRTGKEQRDNRRTPLANSIVSRRSKDNRPAPADGVALKWIST